MAWERRPSGWFYYRSVRVGGRVRKEYVGGGLAGQLAADFDASERTVRVAVQVQRRATEAAWSEADERLRLLGRACDRQLRTVLEAAGFHRPKRQKWRKRRAKAE